MRAEWLFRSAGQGRQFRVRVFPFGTLLIALALALPAAGAEQEEQPPPVELLEFLGSFETADGKWIDPTRLEPPQPTAPAKEKADAKVEEEKR